MIRVWYTNGVVQDYPSIEAAQAEIAVIMELDSFPFALIKGDDGTVYGHRVEVKLEPVKTQR